jgi:sec-independent protein translocase protein TatA
VVRSLGADNANFLESIALLGVKHGFIQYLALANRFSRGYISFRHQKLGNVGADLGKAVKGFKDGVKGEEEKSSTATQQVADKSTIDVDAKEKSKQ